MTDDVELVRGLWDAFEARDWRGARGHFHEDAVLAWHCTGERFDGADAIIHVQAVYPEGWSISLLDCALLADGRVLSVVQVDQPPLRFFATSLFTIDAGLIRSVEEYWATAEAPPDWRRHGNLPGYSNHPFSQHG